MISGKGYSVSNQEDIDQNLLKQLDRGIDDMEAGRELPIDEAFLKISKLRKNRRDARV